MDITFSFWHIVILAAASGVGLILAANAKVMWANRYDTAITIGIVLIGLSAVSSAIYGMHRSHVRADIEAEEHRIASREQRQEAKDQYLPGIWDNVFDAVDNVYGWESKWAILEAVPVRYGIDNVHALPGQGFDMILREFFGVQVKIAVRELLRPYITPFPDDGIGCASMTENDFGELLVLRRRKETE